MADDTERTDAEEREAGLAAWHAVYHPDTIAAKVFMKGDLIRLLGRYALDLAAARAEVALLCRHITAVETERDDWRRAYDQERNIMPADGVWLVEHHPGGKSYMKIAELGELPDPLPLASIMRHRDLICRVIGEQWETYRAGGSQSRWDIAEAIMRAIAAAETA